ncbi:hypothetical protein FOCC_FOCC001989 [Frankliniella occidentalis]|nr:hypothetical protein FOCC_FOCC001989 [Frankliniella occidentalis]
MSRARGWHCLPVLLAVLGAARVQSARCPFTRPAFCNAESNQYRTFDGSCNNQVDTTMGKSNTPLLRVLEPNYANGIHSPRRTNSNQILPSARRIVTTLLQDRDVPSKVSNIMVMTWAQLVSHDVSRIQASFPRRDGRVTITPMLAALQTLFMREHNRVARRLASVNLDWSDEELFQEARRIVIAEWQLLTYRDWLQWLIVLQIESSITNKMFRGRNAFGSDLMSVDIQRGREHGLPSYNEYREHCRLRRAESFDDFNDTISAENIALLRKVYDNHDDVDFLVGGLLEQIDDRNPLATITSPTFRCVIVQQFKRWKRGDRFFFDLNKREFGFSPAQLQELRKVTMSRLICDNTPGVTTIPDDVFLNLGVLGFSKKQL